MGAVNKELAFGVEVYRDRMARLRRIPQATTMGIRHLPSRWSAMPFLLSVV
jgi:hypothetical protein